MTVPRTAVPVTTDRNFPAPMFGEAVQRLHASGVVDDMQMWDQLTSWWPAHLWTPENTPMAQVVPDVDSFPDVFAYTSSARGATRRPSISASTAPCCCTRMTKSLTARWTIR
jgi:phthiodiolone/phenolphthiodiolone dimycocerosates ketoreductase